MKVTDWIIALALVIIGLSCLTMSGTWMMNPESITPYLNTLLRICIWLGIPVIIAGGIYVIIKISGKRK